MPNRYRDRDYDRYADDDRYDRRDEYERGRGERDDFDYDSGGRRDFADERVNRSYGQSRGPGDYDRTYGRTYGTSDYGQRYDRDLDRGYGRDSERYYERDYDRSYRDRRYDRYTREDYPERRSGTGDDDDRYSYAPPRPFDSYDRDVNRSYGRDAERNYRPAEPRNLESGYERTQGNRNYEQERGNYSAPSYDRERGYERSRPEREGRGDEGRGWWDRMADEVASWFGDAEAEGRRRIDDIQGRQYYGRSNRDENRRRGPRNYRRSDERIREDVSDRLADYPYLDASEIEVRVENGEVILSGTVNTRREKRMAEDLAESISGVEDVQNNLRVKRVEQSRLPSPIGTAADMPPVDVPTTGAAIEQPDNPDDDDDNLSRANSATS